jgi:sugar phosphate isomerase/epimerase
MKDETMWGFACPWYWEFMQFDKDPLQNRIKFFDHFGLKLFRLGIAELDNLSAADRDKLLGQMKDRGMKCFPGVYLKYTELAPEENQKQVQKIAADLQKYRAFFEGTFVHTGLGAGHRFDRTAPVEEKLAKLTKGMAPLAQACWDLGTPLGVENHGDFYVSDIVQLCKTTPHLYLFLDTGNTYLLGEKPLPAMVEGAPYTIGTHFKDHTVKPNYQTLHFEVEGAALGDGDVPLRECWKLIKQHSPFKDKLMMEIEMVSPKGVNPMDAMTRSVQFLKTLEGVTL